MSKIVFCIATGGQAPELTTVLANQTDEEAQEQHGRDLVEYFFANVTRTFYRGVMKRMMERQEQDRVR